MAGINVRNDAQTYADLMVTDAHQASAFMQKTFYPSQDIAEITAERQRHMAVIFQQVTQSLFSVLFFYILFGYLGGLFGAVFYRLVYHFAHDHEQGDSIQRKALVVLSLLDWIPFRLFALTLVILSSFERVFPIWSKVVLTPPSANNSMLSATGFSALKIMPTETIPDDLFPEKELLSLVDHSLVVWLGLIAIVTLIATH
jgi:membrane protein required for beta-lactamase induction